MADITMCTNEGCKFKTNCYRYLAKICEFRQSYFTDAEDACVKDDYAYYWEFKKI